jgi:putative phosphoesterase
MQLGVLADIHGDWHGFAAALRLFDGAGVSKILCAGDIVDRGSHADQIVRLLRSHSALCIRGNHEHTVLAGQERWRSSPRRDRFVRLGRVLSDETVGYIQQLPASLSVILAGVEICMTHGTPWSDLQGVFLDSRPTVISRIRDHVGTTTRVLILGHTHRPMWLRTATLNIVNPGSVYGMTSQDSHTCAVLTLPQVDFTVYDLHTGCAVECPGLIVAPDQ